jgi:hypothetical protein
MNVEVQPAWKPHPKQQKFIELPFDIDEALYGGAVGGGKSELLLWLPVVYGFHQYPAFHGVVFRETFPQLESSLIPRAKLIYERHFGAKYNEQKHVFTFPSGARMRMSYLEHDDQVKDHDTNEYQYIGYDELTAFTYRRYNYIVSARKRSSFNLPAITRVAATPGGQGHLWVREHFIEPAKDGNVIIFDKRSQTKRIFIKALLTDNPHLLENDPNYINRLRGLPEHEYEALVGGNWWVFSGQVFNEFRIERYSTEPENALHVIPAFEIPEWWPKIVSIDWGYDHRTSVHWGAVSPDARCFIYREYIAQKANISEIGSDLVRIGRHDGNIVCKVIDPSADSDRGIEETVYTQYIKHTGWRDLEKADNDRIGGRLLFHEFLRWKAKPPKYIPQEGYDPERSLYIYRMYGKEAQDEYESLFLPEPPETNLPKLQIFREYCPELIKTIPTLVFDPKRVEDVLKVDGDDPYDSTRYLIKRVDRYVREAKKLFEARQEVGKILNAYSESGDTNKFYRQMELYESKNKKVISIHRHRAGKTNRRYMA